MTNPTKYISIGGDYGLGKDIPNFNNFYSDSIVQLLNISYSYPEYFRIFIPPGTIQIGVTIHGSQGIIARHKIIPVSNFGQLLPTQYDQKLSSYEIADQYLMGSNNSDQSDVVLLGDLFNSSPFLTPDRAGWFYVKINNFDSLSDDKTIKITIIADSKTYLAWYYDINWEADIEDVNVYTGHIVDDSSSTSIVNNDTTTSTSVPVQEAKTFGTAGTTTSVVKLPIVSSVIPPAANLISEFYNLTDLDGNGLIYGYDFKIADDPIESAFKPLTLRMLEQSPYWLNPINEITWTDYLLSIGGTWEQVTSLNSQTVTEETSEETESAGTVGNINIPISPFSDN